MVGLVLLCALVSQVRAEYSQYSEEENQQTETADEPEERVDAGTPAPPTPAPAPTPPPTTTTTPAPAPAPAPRPPVPVERKPANDVNARQSHGEHVRQLQMTNVEFRVGIWLYGDYTDVQVASAVECASQCEKDEICHHWNYYPSNGACQHKMNSGGYNNDRKEWITGNAARYARAQRQGGEL